MPLDIIILSLVYGIVASFACGLGALPLALGGDRLQRRVGLGYAFAGGMMFAACVYNLILPGFDMADMDNLALRDVLPIIAGILLGAAALTGTNFWLTTERLESGLFARLGDKKTALIFLAMCIHSIPEGVAVGVGFAAGEAYATDLGVYIAVAISIHNIPEGLAVAIPLRAGGASIQRCFWMAFLTSLPQPIAAVPACMFAWFFQPLMPLLMGFAAGAMIFLVIFELIPEALETEKPFGLTWAFITGFCAMLLFQVVL